jgi:predicted GTPase
MKYTGPRTKAAATADYWERRLDYLNRRKQRLIPKANRMSAIIEEEDPVIVVNRRKDTIRQRSKDVRRGRPEINARRSKCNIESARQISHTPMAMEEISEQMHERRQTHKELDCMVSIARSIEYLLKSPNDRKVAMYKRLQEIKQEPKVSVPIDYVD